MPRHKKTKPVTIRPLFVFGAVEQFAEKEERPLLPVFCPFAIKLSKDFLIITVLCPDCKT